MKIPSTGAISTSDSHSLREVSSSYTILEKPSFENSEKLIETLRKSIKEHKDFSQDKQHKSIFATYEPIAKLGLHKLRLIK